MLAVRRYDERPKGDMSKVNGALPAHWPARYAIVDDFVCSGETVKRVRDYVSGSFPNAIMAGAILYRCRADVEDRGYSFVDATRKDLARYLDDEAFAASLRIHARPPKDMQ